MERILLTGASSGIGLEILQLLLAEQQWEVVTLSRRHPTIKGPYSHIRCDLGDRADLQRSISSLAQSPDPFFSLINCAGMGHFGNIEEISAKNWDELLAVNLTAPYLLTQFVLPGMKKAQRGRLINISSDADYLGFAGATAYCASKFALRGLGEALRRELVGSGVSVSTISPARVDTHFNGKVPGMRPSSLSSGDVARIVLALLAADARCEVQVVRIRSILE